MTTNRSMPASMVLARAEILRLRAEVARLQAGREIEQTMLRNALPKLVALEQVEALHVRSSDPFDANWCAECGYSWPCATIRAVHEPPQTPQEPREGTTSAPDAPRRPERHPDTWADRQNEPT
jgi:hypothetical protein